MREREKRVNLIESESQNKEVANELMFCSAGRSHWCRTQTLKEEKQSKGSVKSVLEPSDILVVMSSLRSKSGTFLALGTHVKFIY